MHFLNLSRPPFKVIADQSAESAAADLLVAFSAIEGLPDKVSRCFDAVARGAGALAPTPLIVAGRRLARDIDDGAGGGHGHAYHNAQHFCEVMLGANFIALLADLETNSRLEVVLAALIHDFQHDGKGNGRVPFRLERQSVNAAMPYLVEAGVPEMQRRQIAALVLATEAVSGVAMALACHAHHIGAAPLPPLHVAAPELAELAVRPALARQALIVREADVLPSVGLTIEHAMHQQDRLSMEWGVPLGLDDKFRFITEVFTGFIAGVFFQPNVERLRQFLLQRTRE
ncbi:MAG: hypothetical protein Q7U13_05265 [Rhodoferax sp.]|nr:hypothetical protein [Rhodoferax sp.]